MNAASTRYLVWFDTEYTTLDLDHAHLLQVAMIVTDMAGRRVAAPSRDLVAAVRLPSDAPVSDFLQRECPALVRQAREESAPDVGSVERSLVARLEELTGPPPAKPAERPVLAGNTIHADWWLARRFLPGFVARLHYRHLDVSALKLLWLASGAGPEFTKEDPAVLRAWLPGWTLPEQTRRHDALYDVMASIAELNFYRRHLLSVTPARPES